MPREAKAATEITSPNTAAAVAVLTGLVNEGVKVNCNSQTPKG